MGRLCRRHTPGKVSVIAGAAMLIACGDSTAPVREPDDLEVRWASIATGGGDYSSSTCGLTETGTAYCWGDNGGGQLGTDVVDEARVPVPVSGGMKFRAVALGYRHTCAIAVDETVHCWGFWELSKVGTPRQVLAAPRQLAIGQRLSTLTSASWNSCGTTAEGVGICWSGHPNHHTAYGLTSQPQPVRGALLFKSISAANDRGASYWCGLTLNGDAYCWGDNFFGSLGIGMRGVETSKSDPVPVAGGLSFKALSAGYIACGITSDGAVYCWGDERNYPPFQNNVAGGLVPAPLRGGILFDTLSIGNEHACGLTPAGAAYCWGMNDRGQLGTGSSVSGSNVPLPVAGGLVFRTISAGNGHSCGITVEGHAYCWGWNAGGQLGDGSTASPAPFEDFRRVPTRVKNPTP